MLEMRSEWLMNKLMMDNIIKRFFLKSMLLITGLFSIGTISFAQPILPPRTITVTATQALYFGTICVHGLGGTVTLGYDGSRSSTGNVVLLPTAPTATPAIFEIKLCPGRSVTTVMMPLPCWLATMEGRLNSISDLQKKGLMAPVFRQTTIAISLRLCVLEAHCTYRTLLFRDLHR